MVTLTEFISQLVTSAGDMVRIIGLDVALSDPLSAVSVAMGGLVMALAMGALGYLTLGAVGDLLGVGGTR